MLWSVIKKKLNDKNMSEYELAKRTGITQQSLSQMKRRDSKNPRWLTMVKIADALGISLDEFR
jgi:transcriptional regulator with XRE-family HTH domain